ncbi:MAG: GntR family transcriptional regulator [Nitrospirae bacterium]|nr:GntR family transcriptional regulator [Nitrospirota bacterium]
MTETGKFNRLKVINKLDAGVLLDGEELGELFMPRSFSSADYNTGDTVDVFIFYDSDGKLLATTKRPYAVVGDFALLKVVSVTPVGAFLDWGLKKDLLVPFGEQKESMAEGRSYIVYVYRDERTKRIVASSKIGRFLDNGPLELLEGQRVELLICSQTELGYKAIINNSRWGILYKNEIFQSLRKGQQLPGFIKKIRDDGKIDLCLQKPGIERVTDMSDRIIDALKAGGGFISITDKSPAEMIYKMFGASKKTYKKAIGALYKKKLIDIESDGIRLIKTS